MIYSVLLTLWLMIRKAKQADANAVFKIYFHPAVHKFMHYRTMSKAEFRKKWKQILRRYAAYVVENENGVVAFGWLDQFDGMRSHVVEISHIAVSPSEQGKGIGKKLFRFLLEKARKKKARRIQLIAEVDNKKGIAFYKKFGFRIEGVLRKSQKRATGFVDQVIMAKIF